ncbi:MAG: DUF4442 domain-containing protein [Saprospiraceae bacterium]|nr:DUF4442 domain-containing protein [Saprospiraceae bacterium]MBP6694712.1 DUF4442 domain-containing protein [Saprospiraceae bacterium]
MKKLTFKVNNRFWFFLFTLKKLPSLWFWGIRVIQCNEKSCSIKIGYSWFTKNPFKSIYFSALSGAGELSTGLLVQNKVNEVGHTSMLVIKAESHFLKKATGNILFTCEEGDKVNDAFQSLRKSGDSLYLVLHSKGYNEDGVEVANFSFTWALKKR